MVKKCFLTQNGPKAIGPYSTATIHGGVCYLSGMLPVIPETGKLAEGGAAAQVCCRCGVPFMALKSVSDCLTSKHDYYFNFPMAMRDLNAAVLAFAESLEA